MATQKTAEWSKTINQEKQKAIWMTSYGSQECSFHVSNIYTLAVSKTDSNEWTRIAQMHVPSILK